MENDLTFWWQLWFMCLNLYLTALVLKFGYDYLTEVYERKSKEKTIPFNKVQNRPRDKRGRYLPLKEDGNYYTVDDKL